MLKNILYIFNPLSITATRSSLESLPSGFPMGGNGAPAATEGAPDSDLAPQVTKKSSEVIKLKKINYIQIVAKYSSKTSKAHHKKLLSRI